MITKIKDLLSSREHWNKNYFALDLEENACRLDSAQAHSFCLVGAAQRVYGHSAEYEAVLAKLNAEVPQSHSVAKAASKIEALEANIMDWNDSYLRSFEDVKELVERLNL